MKIYAVSHWYDNGESFEDYRSSMDYCLFSTYEKALSKYVDSIIEDYEGRFAILEITLDSGEWIDCSKTIIEQSPWVDCTPGYIYDPIDEYDGEDFDDGPEDFYDYTIGARRNPVSSLDAAWEYVDLYEEYDNYMRNHNYEEYVECMLGEEAIKWLNSPHAINMSSKELEMERNLIEGDKLITELLLDSYAKNFCKEYNESKGNSVIVSLLIAKYREKYEKLGYTNAWIEYLKKLEIL